MIEDKISTYLLLGSNIGNRQFYLEECIILLSQNFEIGKRSSIYETASWGDRTQQAYLNMAIEVFTHQSPSDIHQITRDIEDKLGRKDKGNYLPRTIDIDILFYGNEIIDTRSLRIPHPRLQYRRFVLEPLNEIASKLKHPILKKSIQTLLNDCTDNLPVVLFHPDKNPNSEI
ncbi:MAG: 2-amino-4-hydroxy-6-hydroxymethyldihydropteridine diphosphokinase [Chitinophagales bacterium]